MTTRKYVFGPIASRRLGVSLGVDLVTPKTCPLDCIYCEARATTLLTLERREYVPVDQVIAELDETLKQGDLPDYVTFSGAGEPTLNSRIGDVVKFLKTHYPACRICLLTNGLLLGDPAVQKEIASVDLLIPSLDASNAEEYEKINRPISSMPFDRFVAALTSYIPHAPMRTELEIFIVPGINDSAESIGRFVRLVSLIRPQRVQLNSLDRPGIVAELRPASLETLRKFADAFSSVVPVEIVGKLRREKTKESALPPATTELETQILALISRRPATPSDLAAALALPEAEILPLLVHLQKIKAVETQREERGIFYRPAKNNP